MTFSKYISMDKISADTVSDAIKFFEQGFYYDNARPFLTFLDYYTYINYIDYKNEKCVSKDKSLKYNEFMQEQSISINPSKFFQCIFDNNSVLDCLDEFYKNMDIVKKVITDIFTLSKSDSSKINSWDSVVDSIDQNIFGKKYKEVIKGLKTCCESLKNTPKESMDLCKDIECSNLQKLDEIMIEKFCPTKEGWVVPDDCIRASTCSLCTQETQEGRSWEFSCSAICREEEKDNCEKVAVAVNFLPAKVSSQYDRTLCNKILEYKKCCDNFQSGCSNLNSDSDTDQCSILKDFKVELINKFCPYKNSSEVPFYFSRDIEGCSFLKFCDPSVETCPLSCREDKCGSEYSQCVQLAKVAEFIIKTKVNGWESFCKDILRYKECCNNFNSDCVDLSFVTETKKCSEQTIFNKRIKNIRQKIESEIKNVIGNNLYNFLKSEIKKSNFDINNIECK